jgi:ribosomal-protein-alanine N-acetyltransferase
MLDSECDLMCQHIESRRLILRSMGAPVLEALLAEDRAVAARLLECRIPGDLPLDSMPLEMRLDQIRRDAAVQPWLLRGMIDRASGVLLGHIGFHTPPRPEYLATIAPDAVELGYTVHAPFRRQGYAAEAALALMHWAYAHHGQRCFLLSVSPQNLPSTAMAQSLGFATCGSHSDDEDGLEIEYVRRFEQWPPEWLAKGFG